MQREQRFVQAEVVEQAGRNARVFARHGIDQAEYMHRTQRQVGKVADRRGHDIQRGGRILLRTRRCGRSLGDDRGQGHVRSSDGSVLPR
jgi:hypothetical protein